MSDDFLAENQAFQATLVSKPNGEKVYRFEDEAAVNRFFNGLAWIERFGVPNRNVSLSMSNLAHRIIPFSGEIQVRAA